MGLIYHLTCKQCRYHTEIREDPGMRLFVRTKELEDAILSGKEPASEQIRTLLENGCSVSCVHPFLCPVCKTIETREDPYIFKPVRVTPHGTVREYRVHYIYGIPKCGKCQSELQFIPNARSSKVRCPKCSGTLHVSDIGYYD